MKLMAMSSMLLCGAMQPAVAQVKSVVNDNYGYTLQVPAEWSIKRVKLSDPLPDINDFKAGRAELKGVIETGPDEPKDWNAVQFNGVQPVGPDGKVAWPQITVYSHPRASRTFDEFTKEFGEWLAMFRTKPESAKTWKTKAGVEVYDYVYRMGPMPVRLVVLYDNGVRYGFMYMDRDSASFEKHTPSFDRLVGSIEVRKPKAAVAVN